MCSANILKFGYNYYCLCFLTSLNCVTSTPVTLNGLYILYFSTLAGQRTFTFLMLFVYCMAEDRVSDVNRVQDEDTLKMEVTCLSKTSVNLYQMTWCHSLEDDVLQVLRS